MFRHSRPSDHNLAAKLENISMFFGSQLFFLKGVSPSGDNFGIDFFNLKQGKL